MANKLTPPPPTGIGILDRWLALLYRLLSAPGQLLKEQISDFAHNHTADNDGGALTNDLHDGYVEIATSTAPSTPAAGKMRIYAQDAAGVARLRALHSTGSDLAFFRDAVVRVKNTSGGTINKGEIVYCTGATGNFPTIAKAKANAAGTMPAIGMVLTTAVNNAFTTVQTAGEMTGLDTSAFAEGASLFVSATTAGAMTATEPQHPFLSQEIGFCTKSNAGAGSVQLFCTPAHEGDDFGSNRNTYKIGDGTAGAKVLGFVNAFLGSLSWNPTAERTLTLPDATGTLATTTAAIDPVSVGATTPGSGAFTSLSSSGNTTVAGKVFVGTTTSANNTLLQTNIHSVVTGDASLGGAMLTAYCGTSSPASRGPVIGFQRSRGTTDQSLTVVASGDRLGNVFFSGADGTAFLGAASIQCFVDGTPGANDMPGRIVISTTADGAATPTERLRIDSAGLTKITGSLTVTNNVTLGDANTDAHVVNGTLQLQAYTVATLPAAGTAGRTAYVTDATAPTYLGVLTGGGAVKAPVFDNGTAWVSH